MPTLKVSLNNEQMKALQDHAKAKGRPPEEDLVRVWWGRTRALLDYAGKLKQGDATFRPYAPKLLPDEERDRLKRLADAKGIATPKKAKPAPKKQIAEIKEAAKKGRVIKPGKAPTRAIADYDSPGVALAKAKGDVKVLKAAGRDKEGRRIK